MKVTKTSRTVIERNGIKVVQVSHAQEIKQSHNFQSAATSFGVVLELPAGDEDKANLAAREAKRLVEEWLVNSFDDQQNFLKEIGKGR